MTKPATFIVLFLVGALVMFLFDQWYTLLIGAALQIAAIVTGVFVVATPEFLEGDSGETATEK
jgi:TM2 domain-containing membrane protein YozV